jgi:Flp pilus assembly protein TadD
VLRDLLAIDPTSVDANLQLALLLFDNGEQLWAAGSRGPATEQFREAVVCLDRVLAARPAHGKATLLKGVALERFLGRPAEGLVLLREFVRLRPEVGEGHLLLGQALAAAGRPAEARASLKQAAALAAPGDTRAAAALAGLGGE